MTIACMALKVKVTCKGQGLGNVVGITSTWVRNDHRSNNIKAKHQMMPGLHGRFAFY